MATSSLVPGSGYMVALDGHEFVVDLSDAGGGFMSASIPMLRQQSDQGARPGEQSLSPDDLWRRSVESWHHGAGQSRADRQASDPYRFRTSLHLNPWERYELTRLNTTGFTNDTDTGRQLLTAQNRLYWMLANELKFATTLPDNGIPSFTPVTGLPAAMLDMASDGVNIYSTHGVADIYLHAASTTTAASYITNATKFLFRIFFAKGRLIVFDTTGSVYNPVAAGALPTALYTHPLAGAFSWQAATDGTSFIYLGGVSGIGTSEERGVIYRTAVKADGTALDVPVVAGRLPDGEGCYALLGYLGLVFIGTTKGVRVAKEQSDGSLVIGALIEGPGRVVGFEAQGNQVWFTWNGDDAAGFTDFAPDAYRGLGRIDLSDFDGDGAPAYATDLMVALDSELALVWRIVTYNDRRCFIVALASDTGEMGLYCETTTTQTYSHLVSGLFNFGLTEPKTFHYLGIGGPLVAPNVVPFVTDTSPYEVGSDATFDWYDGVSRANMNLADKAHLLAEVDPRPTENDAIYDLGARRSNELEYRLLIAGTINRITLQARPAVTARTEKMQVPLMLSAWDDVEGQDEPRDVRDELNHIRQLVRRGTPVPFQDGNDTYDVIVEDYRFIRTHGQTDQVGDWNGVCVVTLKRHDTVTPLFRSASSATLTADDTLTVVAPDGAQTSDVLYLVAAWDDTGAAAPTPAGWTLLETNDDTGFASATWWRVGGANTDVVFSGAVNAVAVCVAYSQGSVLDQTDSVVGTLTEGYSTPLGSTFTDGPVAVVTAVGGLITDGSLLVGPARPRKRAVLDLGATVLVAEVGDAVSTSKIEVAGAVVDQINYPVFFTGTARAYAHRLK